MAEIQTPAPASEPAPPPCADVRSHPSWNLKCIVFTLLLAAGYWLLPPRNKWILLALLYLPYIAMAWYDDHYQCSRDRFGATFLHHFYFYYKPADYKAKYACLTPTSKRLILAVDLAIILVLLALAPRFLAWRP